MWSKANEGRHAVPPAGLLAGMAFFAYGTGNTESRSAVHLDPALAYPRLINTPNTSNTARIMPFAEVTQTDAGAAASEPARGEAGRIFRARDAIFELRRLTGLTWEDLAALLSVTRRSLHLWANGQPINTPNEKRLRDFVTAMRALDRGTARENRSLLMSPQPEGRVFSDLLQEGRFEEALSRTGRGNGRPASSGDAGKDTNPVAGGLSFADALGMRADRLHTRDGVVLRRRRPRRL